MPRTFRVTRDQAVWERETWHVTVPDNVEDAENYIGAALDASDVSILGRPDIRILDHAVDGISTEVDIEEVKP